MISFRAARVAFATAVLLPLGTLACSSDGDSSASTTTAVEAVSTVGSSDGAACDDPLGDIGAVAGNTIEEGSMTEPAGLDIVAAGAVVTDTTLDVAFETAGDIDAVPSAQYIVLQGQALQPLSFELRIEREALGPWQVVYVTWPDQVESRQLLPIEPVVDGTSMTVSVPLDALEPLATQLAFGASAEVGEPLGVVFDECSSLSSS